MKYAAETSWTDREYTRISEAGAALGVSAFPIRKAIREGALPAYKIGRSTLLKVSEVKAWFEGRLKRIEPDRK